MRWFILAALTVVTSAILMTLLPQNSPVVAISESSSIKTLQNYDIRNDKSTLVMEKLRAMRSEGHSIERRSDAPFEIEYNDDLDVAEIISPTGSAASLARRSTGQSRATVLKNFVTDNRSIFGVRDKGQLHLQADYKNPDGNLSFVRFTQDVAGVPVFGAEVKAGFSRRGEMFRVINSLAYGIDENSVGKDFGESETAIVNAAANINVTINADDLARNVSKRKSEIRFSSPLFTDEIVAERYYFPIGNGVVRSAWQVLLSTNGAAFYVVIDAANGSLLWRKDLIEHQTLPATYSVYGNQTSLMKTADSPSPFTPGCLAPTGCPQRLASIQDSFTLIGNESPYTFNNLGWIPDTGLPVRTPANANITDGNNVETGIDRDGTQGVDNNGWAFGNPTRNFSFDYSPAPGIPPPGAEPLPTTQTYPPSVFQQGVAAHGFYTINRWHDEMYRLGFNEQAGNFQHFNFGRGGTEGDRISFEIQDGSGTNAANFFVPNDGNRPRLQMFIWTGPTPDRDGALDSQVVLHEVTHGLSNRLIGNATGLGSNMSRGMGEGWSDFYALALLSQSNDDRLGTYTIGGYASYLVTPDYTSNYYYGLRRFPVAVWGSRGPNGLPHNPLTFRYINTGCNNLIGTDTTNPNSAFPRGPIGVGSPCDQVHNMGEFWAVTLWEVRDQLIQRHFDAEGNRRTLQYVTDAMKLSPLNPTILQMRDAILAAASVSDANDVPHIWRGFSIRGLGTNASIQNAGTGNNNTAVTESFSIPAQFRRPARADFDGDGRSDTSVFRPSDRIWYLNRSTAGFGAVNWGLSTDVPVTDDFDGDGKADITVFRATNDSQPDYYTLNSATSTITYASWGIIGDIPLSEDFDADNRADLCVYRPSTGRFWIRRSSDGSFFSPVGMQGGVPLVGDFDGDGRGDLGTFGNGFWSILRSGDNYSVPAVSFWGETGDKAVHADYDGDGRDDIAVYKPTTGTWSIRNSSGGSITLNFGISTDIPAPADYDGDGRADIAIYRDGFWWINGSTSGIFVINFGLAGDKPLPATYIP